MNVTKIITELRQKQEQLNMAIISLERLAASSGQQGAPKRRGRPPGSKNKPKAEGL